MLDFVITPTFAEQVTFLGSGQVDAGLIPYTSFVALFDAGAPVKVIAGGGIQGCVLVAQPGLDSPEKLKGKTLGTFQMDTLEVLPYDWMKKHKRELQGHQCPLHGHHARGGGGVQGRRARPDLHHRALRHRAAERREGQRDAVGRPRHLRSRLHRLRAGGARRPDQAEPHGAEVADQGDDDGAVHGGDEAGGDAADPGRAVLQDLAGERAHRDVEAAVGGGRARQTQFILDRVESIAEMGYIKKKPGRDAIDWTLLEQVIAENQDLYGKLKYKSAA